MKLERIFLWTKIMKMEIRKKFEQYQNNCLSHILEKNFLDIFN